MDILGSADPYIVLTIDGRTRKTDWIKNDRSPIWNLVVEFDFGAREETANLSLHVGCYDHDLIGKDDFIGEADISLKDYVDGTTHNQWFPISDKKGGARGEVRLELTHSKT